MTEQFVGERIAGRFVIDRPIGEGPISSAFRARDELLSRRVTVKIFHPQHPDDVAVVDSQLELASAVARLSHPNIVTIIDRGEHDGRPFVVLEYVRGENLQERIDRYAPLAIPEVVMFGTSIARALAYAHSQHVVHGNLRPGNVLISEDREPKLVDFGGGSYLASLTNGDPYAAPEIAMSGGATPDATEDIYALGALLYVALTENDPTADVTAAEIQMQRPDAPPKLTQVIERALTSDIDRRYSTMRELASDLSALKMPSATTTLPAVAAGVGEATQTMPALEHLEPVPAANGRPRSRATERQQRRERPVRSHRERRTRTLVWTLVIVPLVLLAVLFAMLSDEGGNEQRAASGEGSSKGALETITPTGVHSFDPPPGDGEEKDDQIDNLIDDDPKTAWETEGYDNEQLGGIKPGVGFYLTFAEPVELRQVVIATKLNGWNVQVYGADEPKPTLDEWTSVSESSAVESDKPIDLDPDGKTYDTYLFWIDHLAIDDKFRARAGNIVVKAEPSS